MTTPSLSRRSLLGLAGAGAGAMFLSACGDDDKNSGSSGGGGTSGPVTIKWWHISITDPGKTVLANLAKAYETAHPNVKIEVNALENEAFKSKLTTISGAGDMPDVFQSWGGGVLAQQAQAGLVKDITDATSSWSNTISQHGREIYQVDGKQYGYPYNLGMVGFWYNKDMFSRAGITAPPATWTDYLSAVQKLKSKGITPIALAGGESWTGMYYWAYLALRIAGVDGIAKAAEDGSFDSPDFVQAGAKFKELIDLQPFQKGFLATKYSANDGQPAFMGNGQTAMELMGQWAPPTEEAYSTSKKGIGDKLGFFPFPQVEGGKGSGQDAFGGGDGFAIGKNAPDAAVDFVKFLLSVDNQKKLVTEAGGVIPVTQGAEVALTDPNLKQVQQLANNAPKFQLYLDQAYPPELGQQINDSVAKLYAGKTTPEKVAQDIAKVAKTL
jgi:raffinose/stachyose/melibiose transport system substrate-binding protein